MAGGEIHSLPPDSDVQGVRQKVLSPSYVPIGT